MSGTANPVDLITGIATTGNVSKSDISAWAKARVAQVLANASEVRSTNMAAQLMVTLNATGALLFLDSSDHTTADDGINCIVSADGGRYKPKFAILAPTAVSLGGVFSSSATAHHFATGVDTSGNVTYGQPALADLSDGLSMDTDGTLSANSDSRIASQKAVKTYVDTVAQGLDPKQSVLVATTANITLSGEQTIDGTLTSASRVLVKNQTTASQNGIYVSAAGAWARSLDADTWIELPGAYTFVEQGAINGDSGWTCTVNAGGTLGTTAVTFTQFAGAGTYTAGSGLTLTGTQFSVGNNQITNAMRATMAAYTIKGNNSGSTGNEGDIDVTALTLKASPVSADVVLIQDSAASFAFKKTTAGALASAGSVSSVDGVTGAVTIGGRNRLRNSSLTSWFRGTGSITHTTSGGWGAEGVFIIPTGASCSSARTTNSLSNPLSFYAESIGGATGVTDITVRFVVESLDAAALAGRQVTFQVPVLNLTGGSITPTITVKRANAQDATYTNIDVSAATLQTIANNATGVLSYSWSAPAGTLNGLSIDIDFGNNFSSGAKSILIGGGFDLRATPGQSTGTVSAPPAPEVRSPTEDSDWNKRFYLTSYENGTAPGAATHSGMKSIGSNDATTGGAANIDFSPQMRATPSVSTWDGAGNSTKISYLSSATWTDNSTGGNSGAPISTSSAGFMMLGPNAVAHVTGFIHFAADATLAGA